MFILWKLFSFFPQKEVSYFSFISRESKTLEDAYDKKSYFRKLP